MTAEQEVLLLTVARVLQSVLDSEERGYPRRFEKIKADQKHLAAALTLIEGPQLLKEALNEARKTVEQINA